MPGSLDGFEFARLVAQGWPDVGVLVISGRRPPEEGELPLTATFVPKPISPAALVEKVRSMVRPTGGADQHASGTGDVLAIVDPETRSVVQLSKPD
jgi:DNA-binding response OmpR family regulator